MIFGHALNKEELLEESVKSDVNNLNKYLRKIICHLLKFIYQPENQTVSWVKSIFEDYEDIQLLISNTNVNNRASTPENMNEVYYDGYESANKDTKNTVKFPKERPSYFTLNYLTCFKNLYIITMKYAKNDSIKHAIDYWKNKYNIAI